jgi:DtxR family transcriptional regulator, manganese transport regulator
MDPGSKPAGGAKRRRRAADSSVASQAERHSRIRRDHSQELAEDYVELIAQLIRRHGEARTVDIADHLGVSHVTVARTVNRLAKDGLVRSAPYRSIFLSDAGEQLARSSEMRHSLVVAFLRKIGVDPATAETDAEGIEHHVSEATLRAMQTWIDQGKPDTKS